MGLAITPHKPGVGLPQGNQHGKGVVERSPGRSEVDSRCLEAWEMRHSQEAVLGISSGVADGRGDWELMGRVYVGVLVDGKSTGYQGRIYW